MQGKNKDNNMAKKQIKIVHSTTAEEAAIVKEILSLMNDNGNFFYHKEDRCVYFIVAQKLYGYTSVATTSTEGTVVVFWNDVCDFEVTGSGSNAKLNKSPSINYTNLEFEDLVELYAIMNVEHNLESQSDDMFDDDLNDID